MTSREDDATPGERPRTRSRLKGVVPGISPSTARLPAQIGRYEVLGVVGRGAMGVVYRARDPLLDRVVAVKTISLPASAGDRVRRAFLDRFEREAKAAARISHPAIVTIFDVGLDQEYPFLVMEFLPGETLADRLDRGRIPLPQAYECARELASALGCAHQQRIVHRDVKPANVLAATDDRWKLADFGIVRMPDSDLTQLGTFMGTPGYSPPEAIRDGRYTAQADVFAWGAVFYELLSGQIPYEGPDTETTNRKVLAAEPPSPRVFDPSIPEPLAEVALRALAHDPARRYPDCAVAARALVEAWHRTLTSGAVPVTAFAFSAAPPPPPRAAVRQPARPAPGAALPPLFAAEAARPAPARPAPAGAPPPASPLFAGAGARDPRGVAAAAGGSVARPSPASLFDDAAPSPLFSAPPPEPRPAAPAGASRPPPPPSRSERPAPPAAPTTAGAGRDPVGQLRPSSTQASGTVEVRPQRTPKRDDAPQVIHIADVPRAPRAGESSTPGRLLALLVLLAAAVAALVLLLRG